MTHPAPARAFNPERFLVHSVCVPGALAPGVAVARCFGTRKAKDVELWEGHVEQRGRGSTWLCAFPSHTRELVEVDHAELSIAAWRFAGRLRLGLWLATKLRVPIGSLGVLWDEYDYSWRLGNLEHHEWFVGTRREADAQRGEAHLVPALAELRGMDPGVLLPDTTREIDALALKLVVEHGGW